MHHHHFLRQNAGNAAVKAIARERKRRAGKSNEDRQRERNKGRERRGSKNHEKGAERQRQERQIKYRQIDKARGKTCCDADDESTDQKYHRYRSFMMQDA